MLLFCFLFLCLSSHTSFIFTKYFYLKYEICYISIKILCEICPIDNWSTVRGGGQAGWRPCLRLQCGGRLLLPLAESTLTRTTKCIFPNSKMYLFKIPCPHLTKEAGAATCCLSHLDITTTPYPFPIKINLPKLQFVFVHVTNRFVQLFKMHFPKLLLSDTTTTPCPCLGLSVSRRGVPKLEDTAQSVN